MSNHSRREILRAFALGGMFVAGELWIPGKRFISIPKVAPVFPEGWVVAEEIIEPGQVGISSGVMTRAEFQAMMRDSLNDVFQEVYGYGQLHPKWAAVKVIVDEENGELGMKGITYKEFYTDDELSVLQREARRTGSDQAHGIYDGRSS